ncbi:hypothetical protein KY335_05705, partial [Candidatus Woesearchaeota archaeon]|nr:hypothetical protein [Candidatus Woesearchaeota archaeon]
MGTQGYKSNNLSDEVKHSNLENLTRLLIERNPRYVHYFELHSGAGRYRENGRRELRDGSAIRVLNMLRSEILVHEAFLHEKDPKLRARLKRNIRPYVENNNISVFGDWRDEIEEHLTLTNYESIYVLDPTHLSAYDEEDGLLVWLGPIIENSSAVFMYAPQNINPSFPKKKRHARTINM